MRLSYLKLALPCVVMLSTSGCIDKEYDLSDVDTTTEVKVTDLVLPINIDAITLDNIFDTDEDDQLRKVTDQNGKEFYAFVESGEFKSDPISIERVKAPAPVLNPTRITANISAAASAGHKAAATGISFDITRMGNECSYEASNIDKSILNLTAAQTNNISFKITLEAKGMESLVGTTTFTDLKFQLFKGLTPISLDGEYDAAAGVWTVSNKTVTGTTATFSFSAKGIDLTANDATFDANNHTMLLPGEVSILSGVLTVTPKTSSASIPSTVEIEARYDLGEMEITAFSGRIHYQLEGMSIDPISISNLPDFLDGDDTNLFIANPQIYLSVNNPVANDKLSCRAGLTLTAQRPSVASVPDFAYSAASPITIGYNNGVDGPYNFVLAPSPETSNINIISNKYSQNLSPISFPGLSNIIGVPEEYGVGRLPEQIAVDLTDPEIIESDVTDFVLGRTLEGIYGSYEFVAPLALSNGSQIVYTGTEDGWNDEDIDAITINAITVTANVTNTTSLAAELSAHPLDVNGNRISNVTVSNVTVSANATDEPVTISITGDITHLDGITYTAKLKSGGEDILTPQQTISLKNIRAKVSGSYIKEL